MKKCSGACTSIASYENAYETTKARKTKRTGNQQIQIRDALSHLQVSTSRLCMNLQHYGQFLKKYLYCIENGKLFKNAPQYGKLICMYMGTRFKLHVYAQVASALNNTYCFDVILDGLFKSSFSGNDNSRLAQYSIVDD